MENTADNMVFLKDIVLSIPLPPLLKIRKDEIPEYLGRLGEISKYTNLVGETYIKFGNFFGESSPLNRVSFNSNILVKVTNEYISCLEDYLKAEIKADKLFPRCVYVEEITLPIRDYSPFPNKVIIK